MIISEIGLNHLGSEEGAFRMLKELAKTDVDAVTFQIREAGFYDGTKPYRKPLTRNFYIKAAEFAHENSKLIGFAVADECMVSFLDGCGADFWKTLSWDISNDRLQNELKKTGKIIFISTGISDEKTILKTGNRMKGTMFKFIHTQLSKDIGDTNLNSIKRLKDVTMKDVAFGLHCSDFRVLYLSLAFEPSDIFFYVKGSSQEKWPDDEHAISIERVDEVVNGLESLKKALGTGIKEKMENKLK
jgi:sialic acid synthase SpsE